MNQIAADIFNAVKKDDLKAFTNLVSIKKEHLTFCYGRFPILSLCYLYNSRKIADHYEKALNDVTNYIYHDEPFEAYELFKSKALRCLKIYVWQSKLVTPIEMLAIVRDSYRLKYTYPFLNKNQRTKDNVKKIYKTLYGEHVVLTIDTITFERVRLPIHLLRVLILILCLAFFFTCLPIAVLTTSARLIGFGSQENPSIIYSFEHFKTAASQKDKYFTLANDIVIPKDYVGSNFNSHINGNGHSIIINDILSTGLFENVNGSISNTVIKIDIKGEILGNLGLVGQTNNGTISNLTMDIKADITEKSDYDETFLSFMFLNNNGDIENCQITADINYTGDLSGDSFLSLVSSYNFGNIISCYTKGGQITTDDVDVSVFAIDNLTTGIIDNCVNYTNINQTSANDFWHPGISGIAFNNYGLIKSSINSGALSCYSGAMEYMTQTSVGGIALNNAGNIEKCKNDAQLSSTSKYGQIFAGGIAAFNIGSIYNSASFGSITTSSEGAYPYYSVWQNGRVGGIAAENNALIIDSYSLMSYNTSSEYTLVGGIVGFTTVYPQNNFFIKRDNIKNGIAAIPMITGELYSADNGTTGISDIEILKALEVYWE